MSQLLICVGLVMAYEHEGKLYCDYHGDIIDSAQASVDVGGVGFEVPVHLQKNAFDPLARCRYDTGCCKEDVSGDWVRLYCNKLLIEEYPPDPPTTQSVEPGEQGKLF